MHENIEKSRNIRVFLFEKSTKHEQIYAVKNVVFKFAIT